MGEAWEAMLHTNGGKLELKKCFWFFITWKWVRGIPLLKSTEEINKQLLITQSEDSSRVLIPLKEVSDAPKVLGCYVAGDGTWDRELGRWMSEQGCLWQK